MPGRRGVERQRFGCRSMAYWVLILPAIAAADEFGALPGLWKTTFSSSADVVWHCVDEDADPWMAFARIEDPPGMTCKRVMQERTRTSLRWRVECHTPALPSTKDEISAQGTIVFDAPDHYTGTVSLKGHLLGVPLQGSTDVEGRRYAACTSPRD